MLYRYNVCVIVSFRIGSISNKKTHMFFFCMSTPSKNMVVPFLQRRHNGPLQPAPGRRWISLPSQQCPMVNSNSSVFPWGGVDGRLGDWDDDDWNAWNDGMLGVLRHFFGLWKTFLEVSEKKSYERNFWGFFLVWKWLMVFLKRCSSNWFVGLVQMLGTSRKITW